MFIWLQILVKVSIGYFGSDHKSRYDVTYIIFAIFLCHIVFSKYTPPKYNHKPLIETDSFLSNRKLFEATSKPSNLACHFYNEMNLYSWKMSKTSGYIRNYVIVEALYATRLIPFHPIWKINQNELSRNEIFVFNRKDHFLSNRLLFEATCKPSSTVCHFHDKMPFNAHDWWWRLGALFSTKDY